MLANELNGTSAHQPSREIGAYIALCELGSTENDSAILNETSRGGEIGYTRLT